MGLFDFLRRAEPMPGPQNLELLAALKAEKTAPSPANRAHLLEVLSQSIVLIAVKDLPPHLRNVGPGPLEEDTYIEKLSTTGKNGELLGIIFSDHANVQARKKGAPWLAISSQQSARWWSDANGIIINPAGDWVELTREEVASLATEPIPPLPNEPSA